MRNIILAAIILILSQSAHAGNIRGGIDLAGKTIAPEVLELRGMVYDYANALASYNASARAQYVLSEARFKEHLRVKNLNEENAAMLDKIREAVLRELKKTRQYLEDGGDIAEARLGIEDTLASYRQYERALINSGGMIVVSSYPVRHQAKR